MRLVLISDTHLPVRAKRLPDEVWAAVEDADVVFHAGDWVGAELRARLPEVARVRLDGVRVAVVHETGQATGRERRMDEAFPEVDVLVFGHSHIPWDTVTPRGMRLLNPGSPTDRRRQPFGTYMTAVVEEGELRDVALHPLPPPTPVG